MTQDNAVQRFAVGIWRRKNLLNSLDSEFQLQVHFGGRGYSCGPPSGAGNISIHGLGDLKKKNHRVGRDIPSDLQSSGSSTLS